MKKSVIITIIIFVTLTYGKTSGSRLTDNDLIINGNAIYLSGQLEFQNIEIINNGVLFLTEENGGKLELFCDSIIVDDGSSIVGNGIIQSGQGTPASGGGAGHGGNGGGTGCIGSGGPAYGLNLEFTGGSAGGYVETGTIPGAGGGGIKIIANYAEINGNIYVNGASATYDGTIASGSQGAGGGSGGMIYLDVTEIYVNGNLYANGGNGGRPMWSELGSTCFGGGGSGWSYYYSYEIRN